MKLKTIINGVLVVCLIVVVISLIISYDNITSATKFTMYANIILAISLLGTNNSER